MNDKHYRNAGIALAVTAILVSTPLVAQQTGEEWEYQGNMEMMGMKMPMPPSKRCEQPQQNNTPPAENNCQVSDVLTEGNTTSFKMRCGPPEPMEGSGTTTRTDDHLETIYTLKSTEGEMTFSMTGKKLGACTLK